MTDASTDDIKTLDVWALQGKFIEARTDGRHAVYDIDQVVDELVRRLERYELAATRPAAHTVPEHMLDSDFLNSSKDDLVEVVRHWQGAYDEARPRAAEFTLEQASHHWRVAMGMYRTVALDDAFSDGVFYGRVMAAGEPLPDGFTPRPVERAEN